MLIVLVAFALVIAACGDDDDTTAEGVEFTLLGAPTGVEADALSGFLDVYNAETGANIDFVGSSDFEQELRIRVEGGNPPVAAFVPQPGSICPFVEEFDALVSLEDMGFDISEMESNHGKFWMDLGICEDGQHYGIPWFPNFKSIIFYNKAVFADGGYEIPETWEDLVSLSEEMVADGQTPWCFGFGSGDATGWPGTDWLEDIIVRDSGGDFYGQWFRHEVPFNSPEVVSAFELFEEIVFGEGFVNGGPENIAAITFQDSPLPLFNDPPNCAMLKQGSFISNFFPEGQEDAVDFFPFPTIGGNTGAMGGGDTIIVFEDDPGVIAAIKDWIKPEWGCVLASPGGGTESEFGGHGVAGVERLPGHKDISPDCYETDGSKAIATSITGALATNNFVFDASDLMPPEVGQGSFWEAMVDFTRGTSIQDIVDAVENSWPMDG